MLSAVMTTEGSCRYVVPLVITLTLFDIGSVKTLHVYAFQIVSVIAPISKILYRNILAAYILVTS